MATKSGNRTEIEIDVEEVLNDLEHKVERLKILYEQYFMGIEKIEPQTARKEITRKIMELTQYQIRNTAMRYRFHALNQKFGAYMTYWNRTMREIENGTYFRSIARATRVAAERGLDVPDEVLRVLPKRLRDRIMKDRERIAAAQARVRTSSAPAAAVPAAPARPGGKDDEFEQTFDQLFENMSSMNRPRPAAVAAVAATAPPVDPGAPPRSAPRSAEPNGSGPAVVPQSVAVRAMGPSIAVPAARGAPLPAGMDETKVRDLHHRYIAALRALGDTGEVRYEQILATVLKQGPKILEQHGARSVEFGVVVRDGKVILKATPKK